MGGADVQDRRWYELARVPAPVTSDCLWRAILEKTEHPERFNGALRGAELLDQDHTVVVRRTQPARGEPYIELLTHWRAEARVEVRRRGEGWMRAQKLVGGPHGPQLVYLVDDAEAAGSAGIDPAYARAVLDRLVDAATRRVGA